MILQFNFYSFFFLFFRYVRFHFLPPSSCSPDLVGRPLNLVRQNSPTFSPLMTAPSKSLPQNHAQISADYLLFDLDGTLVNSTPAVEKTWHDTVDLHNKQHPDQIIDPVVFLSSAHGARTVETFKKHFPYRPSDSAEVAEFEFGIVDKYGHLAVEVKGTLGLFTELEKSHLTKWAIVTLGTRKLAHSWFPKLFSGFQKPSVFVTADDVVEGKPSPEGYLLAFKRLCETNGTAPENSTAVVFEDAPTGIKAGVAGGFTVTGITTTFDRETLVKAGATYTIEDMLKVLLEKDGDKVKIILQTN